MAAASAEDGVGMAANGGGQFDVGVFKRYLESLLLPVMSAAVDQLEKTLFADPTFEEKVQRFATDAGCQVVYITRERFVEPDEEGEFCSHSS
jgi:dynein heavy chain 1